MNNQAAIQTIGITKRFGPVIANNKVDFDLRPGEVHALLGENGAGKTTLMRILYGLYHADEGQILVDGRPVEIRSPKDAIDLGIGMVTQQFTLVPNLTVTENVILGNAGSWMINPSRSSQSVLRAASEFGMQTSPDSLVHHLSVGERQRVEILKALYRQAKILILDEPTAVLVPQEVEALFATLEHLKAGGLAIVFITHKLKEVMAVSDRITVLRAGSVIGTINRHETTRVELARMMVGRDTLGTLSTKESDTGDPVLRVEHLNARGEKGLPALKDVSLSVRAGEILGIAGVSGNGQTQLAHALAGILRPTSGKILVDGTDLTGATPSEVTRAGVGRIPEDRQEGLLPELTVAENLALERLGDFLSRGRLNRQAILHYAEEMIGQYQIKASPTDRMRTLSGGNMQKVILARALTGTPKVILAGQPTRGLDIGATEYVRGRLVKERARGAAILLISEDLDEILAISDRIAVIYEGEIVETMSSKDATAEQLGLLMSGGGEAEHA
jgi:ABC-type uncharacterized transport system ATPase subunit